MSLRRALAASLVILVLALCACSKPAPNTVDDAALDQIGHSVETAMNEPGAAIFAILKAANGPIALDALSITLDQKAIPVEWFLWRRGFVVPLPAQPGGRPAFVLTDKAREEAQSDPAWFDTAVGEPTIIDCKSAAALEALGCEVEVAVTPSLTASGKPLATLTTLPPIKVHALVVPNGEGWEVTQLTTDGASLHDLALNALLGPDVARQEQRKLAMDDLNIRQTQAVPDPYQTQTPSQAYAPLTPQPEIETVPPIIDTTPKRPGLR